MFVKGLTWKCSWRAGDLHCCALWAIVAHVTLPGVGHTGGPITEVARWAVSSGGGQFIGATVLTKATGEGLATAQWTVVSCTQNKIYLKLLHYYFIRKISGTMEYEGVNIFRQLKFYWFIGT